MPRSLHWIESKGHEDPFAVTPAAAAAGGPGGPGSAASVPVTLGLVAIVSIGFGALVGSYFARR